MQEVYRILSFSDIAARVQVVACFFYLGSSDCYCAQVGNLCVNSFIAVAVLAPDIALHVTMDFKSLPEPNWSVERTNAFYDNKLILAQHDLKCSGLVGLSPKSKEKKSINSLLDYVTCTHLHVKKEYKLSDSLYASEPVCATSRKRGRGVQTDREDDENF